MKLLPGQVSVRVRDRLGVCLFGLLAAVVLLVVAQHTSAHAKEYSPYSDPNKTALSVVLSEQDNVGEFQKTFGLSDEQMNKVLSAVRAENEKLAKEYARSEKIVTANRPLSDKKIADKIAASGYGKRVKADISGTKDAVSALLPRGGGPRLKAWVDQRWRQEARASSTESAARTVETKGGGRIVVCKVFATQYIGYTRYEVALPHRGLKFGSQPAVILRRGAYGARPRVREVGPWNTYDNYWQSSNHRTMWRNLPRCIPEARAAYYNNYNGGKDEFGRTVLNPAGVDLTPAVAYDLGLAKYQNAWIYVRFPWLRY